MDFWVFSFQDYDPYRSWSGSQYGSRFSLDHPGTRTLETSRPLGPEHPGTRILSPASLPYSSLQNTKSTYSNSRPSKIIFLCTIVQRVFQRVRFHFYIHDFLQFYTFFLCQIFSFTIQKQYSIHQINKHNLYL